MTETLPHKIYEFEQFRLDSAHLMLYNKGEAVSLPPKAVETLQVLVERNGQIVNKEELMRLIWNDSIVEESNLSFYLHLLRKTLGQRADQKPFIETLRKRGYRFSAAVKLSDGTYSSRLDEFIGRDEELAEISRLLVSEGVRLLTLTGVGGVGKTTLAQVIQSRLGVHFPDGVFFVELAGVNQPDLIASVIAATIGIKVGGDRPAIETLKDQLVNSHLLLILDNFEQLIHGAAQVSDLLNAASGLKIIVTSRVHLRLSVDHEFVVPPLAVPSGSSESLTDVESYAAVRLFVARARSSKPGFALTVENASTVAEICRHLDGLPLAIELAAARTKLMSPVTILQRLGHGLSLLTGGPRDMPLRQQTMRATLQWSYDLLEERERELFASLSVFVGGFTLEAAESVCSQTAGSNNDHFTVLDGITTLIEHNLLTPKQQREDDARFQMLEVVREFATEMLEHSGKSDRVNQLHAEFFRNLGERAEPQLLAAQSADWLAKLENDHDNLRIALQWSASRDPSIGQGLAGAIWRFWWLHGHIREGCDQLGLFLSVAPATNEVKAKLLSGAAQLNRLRGNRHLARKHSEEELLLARSTGDKKNAALALQRLGFLRLDDGELREAKVLLEEGLEFALEVGDKQVLGMLYNGLGELARLEENFDNATSFYLKALEFNREAGDRVRQTTNLINLGATAYSQDKFETAASYYREGLTIASAMDDMNGTLYCLEGIAGSWWAVKAPHVAATLLGAADSQRAINNLFIEPADRLLYDSSLRRVREAVSEEAFGGLFMEGSRLGLDDAVALALSEPNENLERVWNA